MHERILPRIRIGLAATCASVLVALLPGCLDRNAGQIDPTVGSTTGESSSSTTGATTFPGIMTTTIDPDDSDSDATTDAIPPTCGNGKIDPGELCDEGEANANNSACTLECKWNMCGDGHILDGNEVCDDGPDNGTYGHCEKYCNGFDIRCGDDILHAEHGEQCDDTNPHTGCLKNCTLATSCAALRDSWGDELEDGLYIIHRMSTYLTVWCDMDADGGGYTFLKYAHGKADKQNVDNPFTPDALTAADAEAKCHYWGLRLFAPRSREHLAAAVQAAGATNFAPIQKGDFNLPFPQSDSDASGYLSIMGIYPVNPGTSCVGKPFNSTDCPEWAIKPDPTTPDTVLPYWVADKALANQPSAINCAGCSARYFWSTLADPPVLTGFEVVDFMGKGWSSAHFLCEVGDKHGPPL